MKKICLVFFIILGACTKQNTSDIERAVDKYKESTQSGDLMFDVKGKTGTLTLSKYRDENDNIHVYFVIPLVIYAKHSEYQILEFFAVKRVDSKVLDEYSHKVVHYLDAEQKERLKTYLARYDIPFSLGFELGKDPLGAQVALMQVLRVHLDDLPVPVDDFVRNYFVKVHMMTNEDTINYEEISE